MNFSIIFYFHSMARLTKSHTTAERQIQPKSIMFYYVQKNSFNTTFFLESVRTNAIFYRAIVQNDEPHIYTHLATWKQNPRKFEDTPTETTLDEWSLLSSSLYSYQNERAKHLWKFVEQSHIHCKPPPEMLNRTLYPTNLWLQTSQRLILWTISPENSKLHDINVSLTWCISMPPPNIIL